MEDLIHIIYASEEDQILTDDVVFEILAKSRENNRKLNVTGMLLKDGASFFQVLEGEEAVVNRLFNRIEKDSRHKNIVKIICEAIPERTFADWSMGYAKVSREELSKIEGLNDFFLRHSCLTEIDTGRAKKLLKAFADGKWRLK